MRDLQRRPSFEPDNDASAARTPGGCPPRTSGDRSIPRAHPNVRGRGAAVAWLDSFRAIFFTQRELEAAAPAGRRLILCPLGTVDAAAGWPGPEDFWASVGTTYRAELAAYSAVIHLRRTPGADPWTEARLDQLWAPHARRFVFDLSADIIEKAPKMLAILREEAAAALSPDGSGGIASVTAPGTLDDDLAVPDAAELWGIPAEESRRTADDSQRFLIILLT